MSDGSAGYDLLRALGLTVQEFDGLATEVIYVADKALVVVRAGLRPEAREHLVCQVLGRTAATT